MFKLLQLNSKTFRTTFWILLLMVYAFEYASSARILNEPSLVHQSDEPVVAPVATLPSGHFPAIVTDPVIAPVANPISDHSKFTFFMHDILGGTHPSGRVVTGIVDSSDANNLPFSKANNEVFPINGGVPINNINNIVNNNIVDSGNNQPFVTAGQLPAGVSLQQLMFGSITVVNNEITEGHELGSAVLGKAQGFYLTSSSDGTSHTLALTTLFRHDHETDDTISFFGVHKTATPVSHIAIVGGTGKYKNVEGHATIKALPHVDQHITDGVETTTHFTVYFTT